MNDDIQLNDDQKKVILDSWNQGVSDLKDLTTSVFGGEFDGRSKQGRAVKRYLGSLNLKPKPAQVYKQKDRPDLTEDQKQFIQNNVGKMTAIEVARVLFSNDKLRNVSPESKAVIEYYESQGLDPYSADGATLEEAEEVSEWRAPISFDRTLTRVNKFVIDGPQKENLKPEDKRRIHALMTYLQNYRFGHQANSFREESERLLFESTFVRYAFDKPDLTQEEVDQYMLLATESVMGSRIQRRVERLQRLLDEQADQTDEGARVSMALVEAIGKAQGEYNACVKRQQDLVNSLKQKRSDRLNKQIKETASVISLVDMWKEEESRLKLLKIAELQKKAVEDEVERLWNMEEVRSKIIGLSKEEALNG